MKFNIKHEGRTTESIDFSGAVELGYPIGVIGVAIKAAGKAAIAATADGYRASLASSSAGKLAEWRFKAEIAANPEGASGAELALLSREASARGINRTELIGMINTQATAYRQIALLIGVLEAEGVAAIRAVADDAPDIETQIQAVLFAAKAQASVAFQEATALING